MAKNHQRNTSSATPSSEAKPVSTEAVGTEAAAGSVTVAFSDIKTALTAPNIEVQHAWRRSATSAGLVKLWSAMELGRPAADCHGDDVLGHQRAAWVAFSKSLLGEDAPEGPIHVG